MAREPCPSFAVPGIRHCDRYITGKGFVMDIRRLVFCTSFAFALAVPAFAADQAAPRTLSVSGMGEVKSAPDEIEPVGRRHHPGRHRRPGAGGQFAGHECGVCHAQAAGHPRQGYPDLRFLRSTAISILQTGHELPAAHRRLSGLQHCRRHGRDLDKTGAVLDALVSSGSNQIGGISFSIHDPKPLLRSRRAPRR